MLLDSISHIALIDLVPFQSSATCPTRVHPVRIGVNNYTLNLQYKLKSKAFTPVMQYRSRDRSVRFDSDRCHISLALTFPDFLSFARLADVVLEFWLLPKELVFDDTCVVSVNVSDSECECYFFEWCITVL